MKKQYCKKSPCSSCPYRMDAPLAHWSKDHFQQLLEEDKDILGKIYGCHQKDGKLCTGWLMDQDKRDFPNLNLRLDLINKGITRKFLDSLKCESDLYESIEAMVEANFPEILEERMPSRDINYYVKLATGHDLERESPPDYQTGTSGNEG